MNDLCKWVCCATLLLAGGSFALGEGSEKPKRGVVPPGFYSDPKTHIETISTSRKTYSIVVGGNLDFSNSSTRTHNDWEVAFQPNLSLTIENTGDVPVSGPRVVVNDCGRWHAIDALLDEILAGATTDQEKAYAIWQFVTRRLPHDNKIFRNETDELHDPVKMFNMYGKGLCGDLAAVQASLWLHAGLGGTRQNPPQILHLHGHTSSEAPVDGGYQVLDIDHWTFFLDLENRKPVGRRQLARDPYLAKREHSHGPEFRGWNSIPATLFGDDDTQADAEEVSGHRMAWTLRSSEKVVHRWTNVGKTVSDLPVENSRSRWHSSSLGSPTGKERGPSATRSTAATRRAFP